MQGNVLYALAYSVYRSKFATDPFSASRSPVLDPLSRLNPDLIPVSGGHRVCGGRRPAPGNGGRLVALGLPTARRRG